MRRLLLISYYFPPLAGSGVFRPLRLSKYLPERGWEVTVLTVGERVRTLKDPALAGEIGPAVRVVRTPSLEPRLPLLALRRLGLGALARRVEPWLMVPDDQVGWVPFARRRAIGLCRRDGFDAVVSTAGPYSAHLVGLGVRRACGVPWVADFRDEWTTNPYLRDRYPTAWHRRLNLRLERRVLDQADRVVCVSAPWLDALRAQAAGRPPACFRVMPNGYDGAHFPAEAPPAPDRFRIAYTGTFYGHRSPRAFLEAAGRALRDGSIAADDLEIVFMGHGRTAPGAAEAAGVPRRLLRIVGHQPYFESLRTLRQAAVLLLVVPQAGGAGNHTGKLFPYLASRRPILALAPEDNVAADLVRRSRSGVVAPPDDPPAIAAALRTLYGDWKAGRGLAGQDRALVSRFEARCQAGEWAELLEQLGARRN